MQFPTILGPQRPHPNAPEVLSALAQGDGPVVVLTAGWRTDETDDDAVRRYLGPEAAVLPLYTWFEVVMRELPDLREAYRARQNALAALRQLHRVRLHAALGVVGELLDRADDAQVSDHLDHAFDDVRRIDAQLTDASARIHATHAASSAAWHSHPVVERLRGRAHEALNGCRAAFIAGGHVAVLLNRLEFFGVDGVLRTLHQAGKPIIAWSAGSMILTERIVLYYDNPPDGPAFPEVLDRGVGLLKDLVVLPHARTRLELDDRIRVATLARRFGPAACLGLENGAWLVRHPDGWRNKGKPGTAIQLWDDGSVTELPQEPA